ncbi:MAG: 50S ribosomal protein L23 [Patescibacteria group bacterium]
MSIFNKKQNTPAKKDVKKNVKIKNEPAEKASMKDLYDGAGEKSVSPKAAEAKSGVRYSEAYRVLVRPLVTEKAAKLGTQNKYGFVVANSANKIMVARAIEYVYGIKPIRVNIIKMEGKTVRSRRGNGKRKDWKKAIVTLPTGKNINIYEGV